MAYSNDQTQIRAGLVNFIGALLKSSPFEDKAAKQNVASILTEEALKLAQDEQGIFDLYVLKPVFRALELVFKQRAIELSKLPKSENVTAAIDSYNRMSEDLKDLISKI